jgi:hypothetical protein
LGTAAAEKYPICSAEGEKIAKDSEIAHIVHFGKNDTAFHIKQFIKKDFYKEPMRDILVFYPLAENALEALGSPNHFK